MHTFSTVYSDIKNEHIGEQRWTSRPVRVCTAETGHPAQVVCIAGGVFGHWGKVDELSMAIKACLSSSINTVRLLPLISEWKVLSRLRGLRMVHRNSFGVVSVRQHAERTHGNTRVLGDEQKSFSIHGRKSESTVQSQNEILSPPRIVWYQMLGWRIHLVVKESFYPLVQ